MVSARRLALHVHADDERFWSYRAGGNGSLWTLRDLNGKVLRDYQAHLGWSSTATTLTATERSSLRRLPGVRSGVSHYHLDHLGTRA